MLGSRPFPALQRRTERTEMAITNGITLESCSKLIRDVPNFPKAGIVFKDITPLLASGPHFALIVDKMIEFAIHDAANEAIEHQVTPETRDPAALWGIAWRTRSASWMLRHRPTLEAALSSA